MLAGVVRGWLFLMLVGCLCGCAGEDEGSTKPEPAQETGPEAAAPADGGTASLLGRASFAGAVPPPRKIQVNKDVSHCGKLEGTEVVEVEVAPDRGLAGVVIEIQGIGAKGTRTWKEPDGGYAIRQQGCRFVPRFQVMRDGAKLTVHNDDPILHNVNTGAWNKAQIGNGPPITQTIRYRGRSLVRVNCNVHSWMEAWIYVARSPYYAVTGKDGRYRIADIPPGSYRVTAAHPALGEQRFRIEVAGGDTITKDVSFKAR